MPNVLKPPIVVVLLAISLLVGCGREKDAAGPRPTTIDAVATGGSTVREGTMAVAAAQATQGAPGGTSVETCDGGTIRLNVAEKKLVELHNRTRKQRGPEPLCIDPTLTRAARAHSEDMIAKDYFAHATPDGESLGERLKRFGYVADGYRFWKVGGNIAWHSGSKPKPEKMFEGWINSPPPPPQHPGGGFPPDRDRHGPGRVQGLRGLGHVHCRIRGAPRLKPRRYEKAVGERDRALRRGERMVPEGAQDGRARRGQKTPGRGGSS